MNNLAGNADRMLCIQRIQPQDISAGIENTAVHALMQTERNAYPADLTDFFEYIEQHGKTLSQTLATNIEELQEVFLKIVHQTLITAGIEIDARLTVYLSAQGKLTVETSCAGQEQVAEVLAASGALPALLKVLSIQHAVLHDLAELYLITETSAPEHDEKLAALRQSYRVCLKGSLSHFYSV